MNRQVVLLCLAGLVACIGLVQPTRIYIRHKRSLEREGPAKESTVMVRTNGTIDESVKDFDNEITHNEKDCKDFLEFDYNPMNDSLMFNGRLPAIFQHPRMDSIQSKWL